MPLLWYGAAMKSAQVGRIVRGRLIAVSALIASSILAAGLLEPSPSSAAVPRPQGLSATSRTCGAVTQLTQWTTTKPAFDPVVTCSVTLPTTGTIYLSASATVHADTDTSATAALMEFGIAGDGAVSAQSQRLLDVHRNSNGGEPMQLTTQTSFQVGPGAHSFVLQGRRNSGTVVPDAAYAQITGYFVPAVEAAANCISPQAGLITVQPGEQLPVAQCTVTTQSHGQVHLLISSGLDVGTSNRSVALSATIDNGPPAVHANFTSNSPSTSNVSTGGLGWDGLDAGTHVIQLIATGAGTTTVVRQPSISALFVGDTSDISQCAVSDATSRQYTGTTTYQSASSLCSLSVVRPAVIQATATVSVLVAAGESSPSKAEFQLELDGQLLPNDSTDRVVESLTVSENRVAVVQFSVPVGSGAHNVQLFVRDTNTSSAADYSDVTLVVRAVTDAAVIDPPDTTAPTSGGGGVVDYVPVVPDRVLDTRVVGRVGYAGVKPSAGQVVQLQVTGVGSSQLPVSAAAVALNVTGTGADAPGYVTVWPCGSAQPTTSNLNVVPGVTSPNLVISKIGAGGKVCIYTQSPADLLADINGYMPSGSRYVSVVPERLLETRPNGQTGYNGAKPAADSVVAVQVTGAGITQVPADARAVALNVTATAAESGGYVTVWPCGAQRPNASNLNVVAGGTSPNLVISKIGDGGKVCIYTQASVHLLADVNGYLPASSSYSPLLPERLLDTRPDTQAGYSGVKPGDGATIELTVIGAGSAKIPAGTSAVVLNVTGVAADLDGFVTVWPCGTPRPTASNLNLTAGGIVPNLVMTKVGDGGKVCIYTQASAHILADINGYWP